MSISLYISRSENNSEEQDIKREMPTSCFNSVPFKGMDLSPSSKFSFAMQNSFPNGSTMEGINRSSLSSMPLDANQRMMMMLNREQIATTNMTIDEENAKYAEEEEEDDEGNEEPEKGILTNMTKKRRFEDTTDPFSLNNR